MIPLHSFTVIFFSGLGIRSFAHCSFAHLLILLKSNELSDCERFSQIATMSESLRSLKKNVRPLANPSGYSWQMSDREQLAQVAHDKWVNERFARKNFAKKSKILFFSMFYIGVLFKKWAICSFPLFWWAMWANRSGPSPKISNHERIAQVRKKRAIQSENRWANSQPCEKDKMYLIKKLKKQSACMNAQIERGGGGKCFPNKDLGTRVGD